MLEGYGRRLHHERRNLAQHFVWVNGLVARNPPSIDRLVPDPDGRRIYLDEFDNPDAFDAAVAEKRGA